MSPYRVWQNQNKELVRQMQIQARLVKEKIKTLPNNAAGCTRKMERSEHRGCVRDEKARCKCGWTGLSRPYPFQALADLLAHYKQYGLVSNKVEDSLDGGLYEYRAYI